MSKICICGEKKDRSSTLCRTCYKSRLLNKTLYEILGDGKYGVIKLNSVRKLGREILNKEKERKCELCNHNEFEKVLEACHIKDIMSFDKETKIKEINDISNLVWLCPSHHALFDKGLINLVCGSAG